MDRQERLARIIRGMSQYPVPISWARITIGHDDGKKEVFPVFLGPTMVPVDAELTESEWVIYNAVPSHDQAGLTPKKIAASAKRKYNSRFRTEFRALLVKGKIVGDAHGFRKSK